MSTPFIGLSAAPKRDKLYPYTCNTAGLLEGAAFVYDSSKAGSTVKAPTAAATQGFAGLLADVTTSAGTAVGDDINLQRTGIGLGLLKATLSVTVGERLVIGGTDGSLRAYNDGVDTSCDIIGTSEVTLTAGAQNTAIPVNLDAFATIP